MTMNPFVKYIKYLIILEWFNPKYWLFTFSENDYYLRLYRVKSKEYKK